MPPSGSDLSRANWHTSSYSGGNGGQCVEVAGNLPGVVVVRDSKARREGTLIVQPGRVGRLHHDAQGVPARRVARAPEWAARAWTGR